MIAEPYQLVRRAAGFPRIYGFTLIEVMIVVAIIAILGAVAYPSYQDSVWKARRGEARAAIMRALQTQERYFTQKNVYLVYDTPPASSGFAQYSGDNPGSAHYRMKAEACTKDSDVSRCIKVVAALINGSDPKCGDFLPLDTQGVKQPSPPAPPTPDVCWK